MHYNVFYFKTGHDDATTNDDDDNDDDDDDVDVNNTTHTKNDNNVILLLLQFVSCCMHFVNQEFTQQFLVTLVSKPSITLVMYFCCILLLKLYTLLCGISHIKAVIMLKENSSNSESPVKCGRSEILATLIICLLRFDDIISMTNKVHDNLI
ncbi:hypothetical protein FF38_02779 [Lucilia cuprina]|uniref:Uncharacterized protein n=1 Tax=Lucilia cuprina TaxID=7375 RepID=A0A0L0CQ71_LUCCU|nr:hypothetical protein FF38_02779 [Lucilia cuprina]